MEIVEMIRDFGVSIGMLVWFMFRMEKLIQNNTDALLKLLEKLS